MKSVEIYCDGSCNNRDRNPNKIGSFGVIFVYENKTYEKSGIVKNSTNNIAELSAVISSLESIIESRNLKVKIISDSQYCIRTLDSKTYKIWLNTEQDFPNKQYWSQVDQLLTKIHKTVEISFHWIKGHNGHKYNEMADKLAGETRKAYINNLKLKK